MKKTRRILICAAVLVLLAACGLAVAVAAGQSREETPYPPAGETPLPTPRPPDWTVSPEPTEPPEWPDGAEEGLLMEPEGRLIEAPEGLLMEPLLLMPPERRV